MIPNQNSKVPPPGWIGGFAESNPAFAYPNPDLSSIPIQGNLSHISHIKRQQPVFWPEFSWETVLGDPSSRCFTRFAHDISRLGYDDAGRIWSIICPQQGFCMPHIGCLNVEVTVTGQRGWVNEPEKTLAADMGVEGQIWFSPGSHQYWVLRLLRHLFHKHSLPFPSNKAHSIKVTTHKVGEPHQPYFPVRKGVNPRFKSPSFALHEDLAWAVAYLEVEIGPIIKTHNPAVDAFNQAFMDLFNIHSGNMLKAGNTLTWNVWFTTPELVNTEEWATHAERWRHSIDTDHGSPGGPETPRVYFDGRVFTPPHDTLEQVYDLIKLVESYLV